MAVGSGVPACGGGGSLPGGMGARPWRAGGGLRKAGTAAPTRPPGGPWPGSQNETSLQRGPSCPQSAAQGARALQDGQCLRRIHSPGLANKAGRKPSQPLLVKMSSKLDCSQEIKFLVVADSLSSL